MKSQGKALYNLLKLHVRHDPSLQFLPWQIEDLRTLSLKELFRRLKEIDLSLDEKRFSQFAAQFDTPEELTNCLVPEDTLPDRKDRIYLLLFELWRRLLPDKYSVSLFCDELDHRIDLYMSDPKKFEELIEESLAEVERLLESHVDKGEDPKMVFSSITPYLAHDLESFIYLFISRLIDEEDDLYASELLEGFYPYIDDPLWFDLLRLRLLLSSDHEEGLYALQWFVEGIEEEKDIDLYLSVLQLIAKEEDEPLFIATFEKALSLLETNEDLKECLLIVKDHFSSFGNLKKIKQVDHYLSQINNSDFHPKNPILLSLKKIFK